MVAVGIFFLSYLNILTPIGHTGMTNEQTIDLLVAQQENQDQKTLAGILAGFGFMLVLISFGARKKRRGGDKKTIEKKSTL